MARPLRIEYRGAWYHVTCRGDERRPIFGDDRDRCRFLETLASSIAVYGVEPHAYVLMDKHFHFLLTTPQPNLKDFMEVWGTGSQSIVEV